PLVQPAEPIEDGSRDVDADERERHWLDPQLTAAMRVLTWVADHAANPGRADADARVAPCLLYERRETARRDQPGVVVEQDHVAVGCPDAEVGVSCEDERFGPGEPAHRREERLSLGPRPVVDDDHAIWWEARLVRKH